MLAAMLLIPVLSVGTLAIHKMANNSANITMMAAMEEDGQFSSYSIADSVVGEIISDSAKRDLVATASPGYLSTFGDTDNPGTLVRSGGGGRYQNMTALYTVRKLTSSDLAEGAEANTIALEITSRTYNNANPSWGDTPHVEHTIYQEFNMGLVKAVGCAAKYDFFAEDNYEIFSMMSMDFFTKGAYYAGNEWKSTGFDFSFGKECIDTPGKAIKYFFIFPMSLCGLSRVDCNATEISFEHAIYGDSDIDHNNEPDRDQITNLNINGNDGNPYTSVHPYPFTSLEKTVIDKISETAATKTTREATLAALKSDYNAGTVGRLKAGPGYWYFKKGRLGNLPAVNTPYFYYSTDGLKPNDTVNMTSALPFSIDMMRFRNTYMYVNGDITQFQLMGTGSGMNFGNLYLIAKDDFNSVDMMGMSMMDAGLVILTGGYVRITEGMQGGGMSSGTIMANDGIELNKGMSMGFLTRLKMFSGDDIEVRKGFNMSMFSFGSNGGKCGCDGSSSGETTEMQLGRRFSKS